MEEKAIQDQWPEAFKTCWGCGDRNEHGLRIKSYWDGDESVCEWRAEPHHIAFPGYLNGGIIATIIDCHSVNTANAAVYRDEGREPGTEPLVFYVTGSIYVEYLRPTPLDKPVTLRARIKEKGERKTVVACSLYSDGVECARAETVAVRLDAFG
ncbi:MAG: PaaI family thioesterase [Actinomycetota bacterium]|nr:PaaI family thioesterase [Actinomycetota bacterium]MDD5666235.1 PaaI family thioesterase [Actinomycetota bacterium]